MRIWRRRLILSILLDGGCGHQLVRSSGKVYMSEKGNYGIGKRKIGSKEVKTKLIGLGSALTKK